MKRRKGMQLALYFGMIVLLLVTVINPALAEQSQGAIFQMSGDVEIDEDQVINGDVTTMAGSITVRGVVNGQVTTMAGKVTVYGKVAGNVSTNAGNVYLRDGSEVIGNVTALSGKIIKDPSAVVTGSTVEMAHGSVGNNYNGFWGTDVNVAPHVTWMIYSWGVLTVMISVLALGGLLMLFFPKPVERLAEAVQKRVGYYFLIGFVASLLVPPLLILLLITVIGIPLALLLPIVAFLAAFFGIMGIAHIFGQWALKRFNIESKSSMVSVLVGLALIVLLTAIPVIGWLFFLVISFIGFGVALVNRVGIPKKEELDHVEEK